jgi:hypothetical protein
MQMFFSLYMDMIKRTPEGRLAPAGSQPERGHWDDVSLSTSLRMTSESPIIFSCHLAIKNQLEQKTPLNMTR